MAMKKRRHELMAGLYHHVAKPVLFSLDAEKAHNLTSALGEFIGRTATKKLINSLLVVEDAILEQKLWGIDFSKPVGLAAGFDYNGHIAEVLPHIGFGFHTVGTVTTKSYSGNPLPRLTRLVDSQSILVNKGFKSDGATRIARRLDRKNLSDNILGISIGSSNIPEIDSPAKAISDYLTAFTVFYTKPYVKYFELNVSCPNTTLGEIFTKPTHFRALLREVSRLKIKQPILIKMPAEITSAQADLLVDIALATGQNGFIFSNLLKNRALAGLTPKEMRHINRFPGNLSGRPTFKNSNRLIRHAYKRYGREIVIIGCGGVFSAKDAYTKIRLGASLVQLVTGLIYRGPQLIGEINRDLAELLKKDGYSSIAQAVGTDIN